jgi:glycine cleavage system regulatory protein
MRLTAHPSTRGLLYRLQASSRSEDDGTLVADVSRFIADHDGNVVMSNMTTTKRKSSQIVSYFTTSREAALQAMSLLTKGVRNAWLTIDPIREGDLCTAAILTPDDQGIYSTILDWHLGMGLPMITARSHQFRAASTGTIYFSANIVSNWRQYSFSIAELQTQFEELRQQQGWELGSLKPGLFCLDCESILTL